MCVMPAKVASTGEVDKNSTFYKPSRKSQFNQVACDLWSLILIGFSDKPDVDTVRYTQRGESARERTPSRTILVSYGVWAPHCTVIY